MAIEIRDIDSGSGAGSVKSPVDGTERVEIQEAAGGTTSTKQTTLQDIADLAGGKAYVDTTGVAIAFAVPQIYNSAGSPATGNVTLVTTGLKKGTTQILYHNHSSEPTFPAEFVLLFGEYIISTLNIIYMTAISSTRIEYTISQPQ